MPIYMKYGSIKGPVGAMPHVGWVELSEISFSVGRGIAPPRTGANTNREQSVASISEISISKVMDESSPLFFNEACVGKAVPMVEIHLCKTGAESLETFMKYVLTDVLISEYSVTGGPNGHAGEGLSLSFEKLEMVYTPYDSENKAGSPIPAGYDLRQAKKI